MTLLPEDYYDFLDVFSRSESDKLPPLDQAIDKAYENNEFAQEVFDAIQTKAQKYKKITLGLYKEH